MMDSKQSFEQVENLKKMAGKKAAEYIKDGMIVGLGSGSTARHMVDAVGDRVQSGLCIHAVATSRATEQQAKLLGIPVLDINDVDHIDLAIDGVDEIDKEFNATKGGGGALFREKIVATLAKEVIWIMDESKLVDQLGRFPLPVEITPYGYQVTFRKLQACGFNPVMRQRGKYMYVTDNGNYIADLHLDVPADVENVKNILGQIVGVLETGQFLKMCDRIVVGTAEGVKVIEAKK